MRVLLGGNVELGRFQHTCSTAIEKNTSVYNHTENAKFQHKEDEKQLILDMKAGIRTDSSGTHLEITQNGGSEYLEEQSQYIFDNLQIWKYSEFSRFEKIGEGFFGTVYKVNHTVTGEVIVLKELNDASEEDHQKMFMDEIKLLSKLSHTNVLRCKGMTFHGENICSLSEYIDGGSLEDILAKRDKEFSSWKVMLYISMDIARGMAYLHSQGVIHRDLASKNVLIRMGEHGRHQAIVADLGLSHTVPDLVISEEEYALDTVGSPFHMAPEVMTHKPYNQKADVFSYGIMLCEMIAGCPGADPDEGVPRTKDFGLAVEEFSHSVSDCPPEFLNLTVRCCQLNPKERPSFPDIVKALDIIIDKMDESDDEATELDYVIEDSVICTCESMENPIVDERKLGIKVTKDRFGTFHRAASRRMLKKYLLRCNTCGGRLLQRQFPNKRPSITTISSRESIESISDQHTNGKFNNANGSDSPETATPRIHIDSSDDVFDQSTRTRKISEFTAGELLTEDHEVIHAGTSELAQNTPGKLPRFFYNILRHRKSKVRHRDVRRKWRKSLQDVFGVTFVSGSHSHSDKHKDSEHRKYHTIDRSQPRSKSAEPSHDSAKPQTGSHHPKYHTIDRSPARHKSKSEADSNELRLQNLDAERNANSYSRSKSVEATTRSTQQSNNKLRPEDAEIANALSISVTELESLGLLDVEPANERRRFSMPVARSTHRKNRSGSTPEGHNTGAHSLDRPAHVKPKRSRSIFNLFKRKKSS